MTAPTVHADLGVAWITRDNQQVYVDPDEIPAVCASLLALMDALEEAR